MGKKHNSEDKPGRRARVPYRPTEGGAPDSRYGGSPRPPRDDRPRTGGGDSRGGDFPSRPAFGRSGGGKPAGSGYGGPKRFGDRDGAPRSFNRPGEGGFDHDSRGSRPGGDYNDRRGGGDSPRPYNRDNNTRPGGARPYEGNSFRRPGNDERGPRDGYRPSRDREEEAPARPITPYVPKANWPGQPYRQEAGAVPRGQHGERNRKFQKQNPNEPKRDLTPPPSSPARPEAIRRDVEGSEGPVREIRPARPYEDRRQAPERSGYGADRNNRFGGNTERREPGGYERRAPREGNTGNRSFVGRDQFAKPGFGAGDRPNRNERPDRNDRRPNRDAPIQENRADKPRRGEEPGQAPDYKNLKHYEEDKTRGNKRRREEDEVDNGQIRLNRYIANAGICSRREADVLIAAGDIKVNGEVITELGYQVQPSDTVQYGKTNLNRQKFVYVLLNKPKDFITTTVGSSRVDLQACKLEYSIVSPK